MTKTSRSNRSHGRYSNSFPLLQQRRKLEDWPPADRTAWERALAPGGPFTAPGPAAHLAVTTRRARTGVYGQLLSYLDATGQLHAAEAPEQRVTPPRLRGYLTELRKRAALRTVMQQARELRCVLRAMFPDRQWDWVTQQPGMPTATEIRRAERPQQQVNPATVFQAAVEQLAMLRDAPLKMTTARDFRNYLLIAMTACRPLRRRNLAAMRIGRNLLDEGDRFRLVFTEDETKNTAVIDQLVPEALVPHLQHYLARIRPFLLADQDHDRLWVGHDGTPLEYGALRRVFQKMGKLLTGHGFTIHGFRHAASSLVVDNNPLDLNVASAILGHRSTRTTNEIYDRSTRNNGAQVWLQLRLKLRADVGADPTDD